MSRWGILAGGFLAVAQLVRAADAIAPLLAPDAEPQAPPSPPAETRKSEFTSPVAASLAGGLTLYSIGNPSDEEQLYVEMINRARINPPAEAQRLRNSTDPDVVNAYNYFQVDLNQMVADLSALPPTAPLSIHPALTTAARSHSQDMLANNFQGHTGSDGRSAGSRITAAGYPWSSYGENVYAYARSIEHGHAGFEVDWGFGAGGMQSPPGHRLNLHKSTYKEIGVGVVLGSNGSVGPQLVTQDLANRSGLTPFVTGVAYYDFNQNGFYDIGEGVGGITVTASGSAYYAVTATSGGFSVPVSPNTTVTVTFSAAGLPDDIRSVPVANTNVKVDYVPLYSAPVLSGPSESWVGQANTFQFTAVGGASSYEWEQTRRLAWTAVEGAENGVTNFIVTVSGGYAILATDVKASGAQAFHLAHPQSEDQILEWRPVFRPRSGCQLSFASRLGWASSRQVARAQISADSGQFWQDLWSRPGTDNAGQTTFSTVQISLDAYADQAVRLRFVYDFLSGSRYSQTSSGVGWYVDNITVTGADVLTAPVVAPVPTSPGLSFAFLPEAEGDYMLRVRALVSGRRLDWGAALPTTAVVGPIQVLIVSPPMPQGIGSRFEFQSSSGSGASFSVETAPSPTGPWSKDYSARITALPGGNRFEVEAMRGTSSILFYRLVVSP